MSVSQLMCVSIGIVFNVLTFMLGSLVGFSLGKNSVDKSTD